jgi:pimeloyl-ACP methyl ester carboxylesterase
MSNEAEGTTPNSKATESEEKSSDSIIKKVRPRNGPGLKTPAKNDHTQNPNLENTHIGCSASCGPIIAFIVLICAIILRIFIVSAPDEFVPEATQTWTERGAHFPVYHNATSNKAFVVTTGRKTALETILLVHDVFDTSFAFRSVVKAGDSINNFRFVAFDFPGFGLSPASSIETSSASHASWLASLCSSLEIQGAHLVCQGSSLSTCRLLANNRPNLVRSIFSFGATDEGRSASDLSSSLKFPLSVYHSFPALLPNLPCSFDHSPPDNEARQTMLHSSLELISDTLSSRKAETLTVTSSEVLPQAWLVKNGNSITWSSIPISLASECAFLLSGAIFVEELIAFISKNVSIELLTP